jgi:hypothetical protein
LIGNLFLGNRVGVTCVGPAALGRFLSSSPGIQPATADEQIKAGVDADVHLNKPVDSIQGYAIGASVDEQIKAGPKVGRAQVRIPKSITVQATCHV